MEPQLPTPHFGPEATPQPVQRQGEVFQMPKSGEGEQAPAPIEQGNETKEVFRDAPADSGPAAQVVVSPPPLPVIDPVVQTAQQQAPQDDTPAVAGDEDLIEKEWVEKAKKVVAETRNDPYAQDQAVGRLQADYLQKRYGKTIKLPTDG